MQAQPTIRALVPQKNIPTTSRAIRHTFTIRILKKRPSKVTIKKARKILYFFSKKGLTNQKECGIISRSQRCDDLGVAQLVARYLGVVEAASSSLVTQTSIFNEMHKKSSRIVRFRLDFCLFCHYLFASTIPQIAWCIVSA